MKIVKRLRDLYSESHARYQLLAKEVNEVLKPRAEAKAWFFLSRLKALESYALKVETGRGGDPAKMEDFFACTIVVPTMSDIDEAEREVCSLYDFYERRPPDRQLTSKTSHSFAFDDLRLYVARKPVASGKHPELDGLIFEVQVKTVLQYAWSVATHDLIYKADTVSWPRERIAFQVKAMLEHAEVAIAEANRLADAPAVSMKDKRTTEILSIIDQIGRIWSRERLPQNVKRLAETIYELFKLCDISTAQLPDIIEEEKRRVGLLPADLSPYAFTLQALANSPGLNFENKFKRGHIKTKIVIHSGMELPVWMQQDHKRVVNLG